MKMTSHTQSIGNPKKLSKIKARAGHSPAILGKGAPHQDRTKYNRKRENVHHKGHTE